MSLSQEQIISDYQTTRRQLEIAEDDIFYLQRQGEQAVDRAIQTIARRLGSQALGEQAAYLQRDLRQALDDNERDFRQKMRDIGG